MAKITKINHVAIVVPEIEGALNFWRDALGLEVQAVEEVPSQKSTVAFLPTGESEIELVKPTGADSGVARFLQERGAGMHHLCFEVDDIEGMLADLKRKGVRLINENSCGAARPQDGLHPSQSLEWGAGRIVRDHGFVKRCVRWQQRICRPEKDARLWPNLVVIRRGNSCRLPHFISGLNAAFPSRAGSV